MLKKILFSVSVLSFCFSVNAKEAKTSISPYSSDEFQELSEPYRYITGAFLGLGLGYASVPLKVNAKKTEAPAAEFKAKKKKGQTEMSLLAGFGMAFRRNFYTGLDIEFCKRFSKHESPTPNENFKIVHHPTFGLNMYARLGYQFPLSGTMIYSAFGFAKLIGHLETVNAENKKVKSSFGTYSPTIGLGIEKRINYDWSIRLDAKYSLTKKKTKEIEKFKYEGKVSKTAIKLYVTKMF